MEDIFDLEEERLKEEIRRRGARRVLIQLPEGLKSKALRLAKIVEETGALPIISADATTVMRRRSRGMSRLSSSSEGGGSTL